MGFSRQEHWSGLPLPSPGDLPYPEVELTSPALQADSLLTEPPGIPATTLLPDQILLSHVIRDPQPVDQHLSAA